MKSIRQDVCSRLIYTLFFTLIISVFLTGYSHAVTRTVTNLNDNGAGSLRDIIDNVANPGDDIVFDPSLAGGTIDLTTGTYTIDINLTITGPADNPITIDANNNSRIFEIEGGANVVLSNLIIANGHASDNGDVRGGAIRTSDAANLEVNDCTFINNSVEADCSGVCFAEGGAISTNGGLTVRRSTFVGNSAHCSTSELACVAAGGAISEAGPIDSVAFVLENSTLCDNEVTCSGSGCILIGGALTLSDNQPGLLNNNTFSDNKIICNSNSCTEGGSSIFQEPNPSIDTEILNTIIDNDPGVTVPNCSGELIDSGNNLQFPGTSCGGTITTADAMLGVLADNGGITKTKAITEESPAFNAGNNATCEATDQRGVIRPQDIICDIGAYELIIESNFNVPTLSEWGLITMAAVLGIVGFMVMRRRKATT